MTSKHSPPSAERSEPSRPPGLEKLVQVSRRTGLSRSEIYRRVRAGHFPQPVRIGVRALAWSSSEVDGWIETIVQKRDAADAESLDG